MAVRYAIADFDPAHADAFRILEKGRLVAEGLLTEKEAA